MVSACPTTTVLIVISPRHTNKLSKSVPKLA